MRIYTEIIYNIDTMEMTKSSSFEYLGPVAECKGRKKKASETLALKTQETLSRQVEENIEIRRRQLAQIEPFAQMLMALGIDPRKFIQSPLGQSIFQSMAQPLSKEYERARQNLVEYGGASGFGPQEGVAIGPFANLLQGEAQGIANIFQQLPQIGLGLGLQGANVLQGQQAIFDPFSAANAAAGQASQITPSMAAGIIQSLLGAGGSALQGYFGRPTTPAPKT